MSNTTSVAQRHEQKMQETSYLCLTQANAYPGLSQDSRSPLRLGCNAGMIKQVMTLP